MMSEVARADLHARLQRAPTPADRDALLDRLYDWGYRATMWDMDQWGLDPDHWLKAERLELAARGGIDWPSEII